MNYRKYLPEALLAMGCDTDARWPYSLTQVAIRSRYPIYPEPSVDSGTGYPQALDHSVSVRRQRQPYGILAHTYLTEELVAEWADATAFTHAVFWQDAGKRNPAYSTPRFSRYRPLGVYRVPGVSVYYSGCVPILVCHRGEQPAGWLELSKRHGGVLEGEK
jgi:hypothetical protein